jgi:hypothetical protein
MDVKANHTEQLEADGLWQIKQDAFFRIAEQVGDIHTDEKIPPMMRNISLYLETDPENSFLETKFRGIYRASQFNMTIREFVKFDDNNWVVYIDAYNMPDTKDGAVTDLNIENPFARIDQFTIGCVDGQVMIAPSRAERVIAITENFETKKLRIDIAVLKDFMLTQELRNGYISDQFNDEVYLIDSPSPLFAKDTVMYRDSDYVGMWISFGTLLKFDLRNLNVFNIDGVEVGAIDIRSSSPQINTLKLLTNAAYGYASILFDKEALLSQIMKYSKRYIYETNMEDETRICVDNILETLQEKGIFGLLYDDFDVVENYPLIAYDETIVDVVKTLGTVIKFRYKNEYIYMLLDIQNNKMYFASYAGRVNDYFDDKYEYNVKIMNDMWITKANDINPEGFVLFTGFPNLQHNKVIDIYFDNTAESFSDLDKSFTIDVNEFDGFYRDSVMHPNENSYNRNTDLLHAYGNNPLPLVSGLVSYEYKETIDEVDYYDLCTHAEPMISTTIDPLNKRAYLMVPSIKTNGLKTKNVSEVRMYAFLTNYMARWFEDSSSVDKWVEEAEAGSYAYSVVMSYFSNGWTIIKTDQDTYEVVKLNPTRLQYVYNGAIEHMAIKAAETFVEMATEMLESLPENRVKQEIEQKITEKTGELLAQVTAQIQAIDIAFIQEIMAKNNQIVSVVDAETPRFEFKRFLDADNIYINNEPTGPVLNHALLFEDTFDMMQQKMKQEYFDDLDLNLLPAEAYCPYIRSMEVKKSGDVTHLSVSADVSNSIEVLKNEKIGISVLGDMITADATVKIADHEFNIEEAYEKALSLSYFGVRTINGEDLNVFKITTLTRMTDAVRDAYVEKFTLFSKGLSDALGVDYDAEKAKVHEQQNISKSTTVLESPQVPSGQPLYIASRENKIMVSLDGISFMNAPLGANGVELSGRITIQDRTRFLSMLRSTINADVNNIVFSLAYSGIHSTDDVYSVGVKDIWIDHTDVLSKGTVSVRAVLFVDSGQIVLDEEQDLIYSAGDEFIIEQEVDIDGFISESSERIKILVNMSLVYYTNIPPSTTNYASAQELMIQDDAYRVTLGLPISLSISRGDYIFVDRDEAQEYGVSGWFDFTRTGV